MARTNDVMDMVRRFAGCDPTADDTVLQMCYRAAVAWYMDAGVPEDTEDEQYLFWVCNLAAWMYDNRGNADPNAAIPVYIVTSVHQLRRGLSDRPRTPSETTQAGTQTGNAGGGT